MSKLVLEEVTKEDCVAVRDMMIKVYADEQARWFPEKNGPFIPGYHSVEMQEYHTWDHKYYKILYAGKLAGVILIFTTGKEYGRIDRLYIAPEFQNLHIGSDTLAFIEAMYPDISEWSLETIAQSPRNHHFYEKNGYVLEEENEEERFYVKHKINTRYVSENQVEYRYTQDFQDMNIRQSNLHGMDVHDCDVSGITLTNVNLQNTLCENATLKNSRFTNVDLSECVIGDGRMNGVEICFMSMENADIHDINIDQGKIDQGKIDFEKKQTAIHVTRSEFQKSVFAHNDFSESCITDSNLSNLSIENCNTEGMTIDGISVDELLRFYKSNPQHFLH